MAVYRGFHWQYIILPLSGVPSVYVCLACFDRGLTGSTFREGLGHSRTGCGSSGAARERKFPGKCPKAFHMGCVAACKAVQASWLIRPAAETINFFSRLADGPTSLSPCPRRMSGYIGARRYWNTLTPTKLTIPVSGHPWSGYAGVGAL